MRITEAKSYNCVDCGAAIACTLVPGRVPEERAINKLTHPDGLCPSANQVFGAPVNVIDTERIDYTRGPSPF